MVTITSRRKLDLFVAREVMEWELVPTEVLIDMGWSPTSKDDHAMIVFRKMCSVDDPWDLFEPQLFKDKIGNGQWTMSMKSNGQRPVVSVDGPDFGVAVCICALKMKGVEIEFSDYEPIPLSHLTVMEAIGNHYEACIAATGNVERLLDCVNADSHSQAHNALFARCAKWLSRRNVFEECIETYSKLDGHDPLKAMLMYIENKLKEEI